MEIPQILGYGPAIDDQGNVLGLAILVGDAQGNPIEMVLVGQPKQAESATLWDAPDVETHTCDSGDRVGCVACQAAAIGEAFA